MREVEEEEEGTRCGVWGTTYRAGRMRVDMYALDGRDVSSCWLPSGDCSGCVEMNEAGMVDERRCERVRTS